MTYTEHGHHIPGSVPDGPRPAKRARCGGVGLCDKCQDDAIKILGHFPVFPMEISAKNVPVTFNYGDEVIGSADVNGDGTVKITMNGKASKKFMEALGAGMSNGFSFSPVYIPKDVGGSKEDG
jgi:hypothetical protein